MIAKKRMLATLLNWSGLGPPVAWLDRAPGLLCLTYHRVGDAEESLLDPGVWSASAEEFDAQLRYLKRHFDVADPADLGQILRRGRGRFVLLLFDDGYRDNFEVALPILRQHGMRAAFFVTTGFVDRPRLAPWDEMAWMVRTSARDRIPRNGWLSGPVVFDGPSRAGALVCLATRYRALPPMTVEPFLDYLAEATGSGRAPACVAKELWMTWDMVRQLCAAGMSVGGHTVNHPALARLVPDEQRREIEGCARRLREELGAPMPLFSYPFGGVDSYDQATKIALRRAGVQFAFSFAGGFHAFRQPFDPYAIPRTSVARDDGLDLFRARVCWPRMFA